MRIEAPPFTKEASKPYMQPRERVLIHIFDAQSKTWSRFSSEVAMDQHPFSEGALRKAFHIHLWWPGKKVPLEMVGKVSKDPSEPRETYFKDVQAQAIAKKLADDFNACKPPQKIDFIPAYVLELVDQRGRPLMGAEPRLSGDFIKASNNLGGVMGEDPRAANRKDAQELVDLAQCYSHFSYEVSSRNVLVCDIQGVGGLWTDPQIHSSNPKHFGKGNLGETGIRAFLMRHRCSEMCERVGLPKCTSSNVQAMLGPQREVFIPRMLSDDVADVKEESFADMLKSSLEEFASPRREEDEREVVPSPLPTRLSGSSGDGGGERERENSRGGMAYSTSGGYLSATNAMEVEAESDGRGGEEEERLKLDADDDELMESIIAGV
uniref:Alpha-type protein kinase domain-containing protein n=1 Tax=Palpitomonas bilix TaxID=652834 RepID=A0A7S3GC78_9EUKA|mmetsp:Transcript_41128/g.106280  ORF Transcript_41128/g.106280 Transcript_41128/m.106280 type:complete len:379 (+) Transcript_41128:285-1421(+)|eukprot:CAMPEP_0113881694 /NCGR_PEP_ID=MMETSP0780_2-20120614/8524_1 /TAXON_ID=652834 /ORGANISM="Palpitomonas bilix" /LENGTH=378 /DNA_ID=CAMNT_0000868591 /DNA_START=228 /DNA_END=1364 /DNA_ORIENTATION=+ /assembly_acc=CAM_ASM_000599